jgi:hypothetical protein
MGRARERLMQFAVDTSADLLREDSFVKIM